MKFNLNIKSFFIISLVSLLFLYILILIPLNKIKDVILEYELNEIESSSNLISHNIMDYINHCVNLLYLSFDKDNDIDINVLDRIMQNNTFTKAIINDSLYDNNKSLLLNDKILNKDGYIHDVLYKKVIETNINYYLWINKNIDNKYELSISKDQDYKLLLILNIDTYENEDIISDYIGENRRIGIMDINGIYLLFSGSPDEKIIFKNNPIKKTFKYKNENNQFAYLSISNIGNTGLKVILIDYYNINNTQFEHIRLYIVLIRILYFIVIISIYLYSKHKIIKPLSNITNIDYDEIKDHNNGFIEIIEISKYIAKLKKNQSMIKNHDILNNKNYKNILDPISDYVFILNHKKIFQYVNRSIELMTGIPKENMLHKKIDSIFPYFEKNIIATKINIVMATQKSEIILDNNFFMEQGKHKWYEIRIYPVNDGVLVLCSDVSELQKVKDENRLNAERYKAIVENQTELIFRFLPNNTITFVNEAFCNFFSMNKEELVGKKYTHVISISSDDIEKIIYKINSINYANPNISHETKIIIDGQTKWIEWKYKGIYDNKHNLIKFQSVGLDITHKKNVEILIKRTQERLKAVLDSIPLGIILTDPHGSVLYVNKNMKRFLPENFFQDIKSESYLMSFSFFRKIDGKKYPKEEIPIYKAINGYISYVDDIKIKDDRGEIINIEMWGAPIYDDEENIEYAISAIADISKRKEYEIRLKDLNERLKESNKELSNFAYIVSHDLQEPLRGVTGFADVMFEEFGNKLDNTALEYLSYIKDGAYKASSLIKSLLQYSRLDSKEKNFKYIKISNIIKDVLLSLSIQIEESNADITYDVDIPEIYANSRLLESVFLNLLSNAIKFRKDKKLIVKIKAEDTDDYIMFSVSDNGIGIDKADFDKIFIIFQRLHDETEYSGTGLGLALCKKIVEKHKGHIWVESEKGKGSTFYFTVSKNLEQIYE